MTLSEFFYMGGYAAFVWPAYGLGLVALGANVVLSWLNHKQVRRSIARKIKVRRKSNESTT